MPVPFLITQNSSRGRRWAAQNPSSDREVLAAVGGGWGHQGWGGAGAARTKLLPQDICGQLPPCRFRPEVQNLDGTSQCPGLAIRKPEDVEEEEEEELEEDDDSLAGKSQDDTASPTPEPQGAYEDDEDEEPPTSLAVGFDHTRRWAPALCGPRVPGPQAGRQASTERVTSVPHRPP